MATVPTKQSRRFPIGLTILALIVIFGLVVAGIRFVRGLGEATNLSDGYPWGLWITFDVFTIPFSAGAFTMAAVVYILKRERYHEIVRPVLLTGFIGYILVVAILLVDLGRWDQFYSVIYNLNLHSFMFEISWCVMLYTIVLALEFSPLLFEKLNWHVPLGVVRAFTIPLVSAGIILSTLHQWSLGALFLLVPGKLHALWYTPLLPPFFLTTAVTSGLSMAILISLWAFWAFRRPLDHRLLSGLARAIAWIFGFYLVAKLADVVGRRAFESAFDGSAQGLLFLTEMIVGVILPMILFALPKVRQSRTGLIWGSILALVGLALNRANVSLIGITPLFAGAQYTPHWMEWGIIAAAVAGGILVFGIVARFFPVFETEKAH